MESLLDRLRAVEGSLDELASQKRRLQRQVLWWRAVAAGFALLQLILFPLRGGHAQGTGSTPEARLARIEATLAPFSTRKVDEHYYEVTLTGANLHILDGHGIEVDPTHSGNLIIGYGNAVTGSHNVVVGTRNRVSYPVYDVLIAGDGNEATRPECQVLGSENHARADHSTIVGGYRNETTASYATVCGGGENHGDFKWATVSGGRQNYSEGF